MYAIDCLDKYFSLTQTNWFIWPDFSYIETVVGVRQPIYFPHFLLSSFLFTYYGLVAWQRISCSQAIASTENHIVSKKINILGQYHV